MPRQQWKAGISRNIRGVTFIYAYPAAGCGSLRRVEEDAYIHGFDN
jgi:hypothetical protein